MHGVHGFSPENCKVLASMSHISKENEMGICKRIYMLG